MIPTRLNDPTRPPRRCGACEAEPIALVVTTGGFAFCRRCWDDRERELQPQRDEAPRRGRRTA